MGDFPGFRQRGLTPQLQVAGVQGVHCSIGGRLGSADNVPVLRIIVVACRDKIVLGLLHQNVNGGQTPAALYHTRLHRLPGIGVKHRRDAGHPIVKVLGD